MSGEKRVSGVPGVPDYDAQVLREKHSDWCVLIPVINEGGRILHELERAQNAGVPAQADVIVCDGGSSDGSMEQSGLAARGVNTLLVKKGPGRQGAQLRMGLHFALARGYRGVVTVDGNDKDSVEDVPRFLVKLREGYDFVQGSRFIRGGKAENTPPARWLAVRLLHAPVTSLAARRHYTDTTNAYRAYSRRYLTDPRVQPLRDVFMGYELLAYLSTRAGRLGMHTCEVPVARRYPKNAPAPTKIRGFAGNSDLLRILFANALGAYDPPRTAAQTDAGGHFAAQKGGRA